MCVVAHKVRIILGAAAVTLVASGAPARAQSAYREDAPGVLQPPPPPPRLEDTTLGRFRAAYRSKGSPRLLIFWNRALSDQLETTYRTDTRVDERTSNGSTSSTESTFGPAGSMTLTETQGGSNRSSLTTTMTRPNEEPPRPGLPESPDWSAEAAFKQAFIQVGGVIVDRNTAMRTAAVSGGSTKRGLDRQEIETRALLGKANLLMEVQETPDPRGAVGFKWRVTIKDVQSARILADIVTAGFPQDQMRPRWVAGPGGFQKVVPPFSVDDVGRRVGVETMRALLVAWNAR